MSGNYFKYLCALAFCVLFIGAKAHSQNMWGSGYYQGGMVCPYQPSVARNAVSVSDDEKEARKDIAKLRAELKVTQSEKRRAESQTDMLRRKIDRFFDSSVVEFILDVHIESARQCSEYKSIRNGCVTPTDAAGNAVSPTVTVTQADDCDAKQDVPELLQKRWNDSAGGRGPYCVGSNRGNAGSVAASICSDESLRPQEGRRSFNASECTKALAEYRKVKIQLSNKADKEERMIDEIQEKDYAIADARERERIEREYRLANETESECEDCDAYDRGTSAPKLKRDWFSTTTNVVGGILNFAVGQQADRAGREEAAQYGVPSGQSYGYPYYQAGINGVINGLVGPGAYGCSSSTGGGGFQNGLNGVNGQGNGVFGPFGAQGGAFSYPQGMYGSPWGGGAFNPGFNMNGGFNGPFGGTGGYGQFPGNGNMAMCFTWPCNQGGGGPQFGGQLGGQYGGNPFGGGGGNPFGGPQFGGQLGGQLGGQFGNPFGGPQFGGQLGGQLGGQYGNPYGQGQLGMNGQLSMQYQMQMMQMQQQQMQQQMQYYQAQMQAQMQYQQQQQQRVQQAYQIQMQMAQLNMQLQQLYQQNNTGGFGGGAGFNLSIGGSLGGGIPTPTGFPSQGGTSGYPPGYIPGYNTGGGTTTPADTTRGR